MTDKAQVSQIVSIYCFVYFENNKRTYFQNVINKKYTS